MIEYRYSVRNNIWSFNGLSDTTEYFKTLKECKKELTKTLSIIYIFDTDLSIMIDKLDNNIIVDTKVLKGKEFIIS